MDTDREMCRGEPEHLPRLEVLSPWEPGQLRPCGRSGIYNLVVLETREGNRSSKERLKHQEVATQSEKRQSLVLVFDTDCVCVGVYVKAAVSLGSL